MLIKDGHFGWYSPSLFLNEESIQVLEKQGSILRVPHLPSGLMLLQQTIRNTNNSSQSIAKALKKTPAIAVEIIKMANNTRASGHSIQDLSHAVTYLGRSVVSYLAMAATLQSFKFNSKKFSPKTFWQESILIGLISENLNKYVETDASKDMIFLAGCLCNIGKLISGICYPEHTDKIIDILSNPKTMTTWSLAEEEHGKTPSHVNLGDIAAVIWGLPADIRRAVIFHHKGIMSQKAENKNEKPKIRIEEIVGLACLLAHWVNHEPHRINEKQLKDYRIALDWDQNKMDQVAESFLHLPELAREQVDNSPILH